MMTDNRKEEASKPVEGTGGVGSSLVSTASLMKQETTVTVEIVGTCNQCLGPVVRDAFTLECKHCGNYKSTNNYYGPLIPMGR